VSVNLPSCWLLLNTNQNRNERGARAIQIDFSDDMLIPKAAAKVHYKRHKEAETLPSLPTGIEYTSLISMAFKVQQSVNDYEEQA